MAALEGATLPTREAYRVLVQLISDLNRQVSGFGRSQQHGSECMRRNDHRFLAVDKRWSAQCVSAFRPIRCATADAASAIAFCVVSASKITGSRLPTLTMADRACGAAKEMLPSQRCETQRAAIFLRHNRALCR